jgi:hypothetical protein
MGMREREQSSRKIYYDSQSGKMGWSEREEKGGGGGEGSDKKMLGKEEGGKSQRQFVFRSGRINTF